MRMYKFQYKFLLFLYAYLRQLDLSIDRGRWVTWDKVQEYYRGSIPPLKIIDYIYSHTNIREVDCIFFDRFYFSIGEASFFRKNWDRIRSYFFEYGYLSHDQCLNCIGLLLRLNEYLKEGKEPIGLEVQKLRMDVLPLCYFNLKYKIRGKDIKKAMRVEHFFQHDNIKVIPIREFKY